MNMNLEQLLDDKTYCGHESDIQNFWKQINVYGKLNEKHRNDLFKFTDGPPFVSSEKGLHFGHILVSQTKATVLQFQHMSGKNTLNKIGYDTHGLPIEMVINKNLNLKTRPDVINYGIENYNNECRNFVERCSKSWNPIFERIGRVYDYNNQYKTMDLKFMESEWYVFKQLWEKDLVYKSYRVMPYSTGCETPLSNFEASENYKDVSTKSVYVLFKLKDQESSYFVAWTTTPWTLPLNLALCVNPETNYVKINDDKGKSYIVSESCVDNMGIKYTSKSFFGKGSELFGMEYEPIFNYIKRDKYTIITGDFVEGDCKIGTGIVHIVPSCGHDDYEVCIKHNIVTPEQIGEYCYINDQGKYTEKIHDFADRYVFDVNDDIIKNLKARGIHIKTESYKHSYPYCYRTDTPLIYRAVSSYFVRTTAIKDKLLKNSEKINWYPKSAGERYKKWLENIQDWSISRHRFFGTPIPLWISDDGEEIVAIGSIEELVKLANLSETLNDIHLENIQHIQIPSQKGKGNLKLLGEVMDCWMDSACVPFGQIHYPFENRELLDNEEYLSDFVCEGADQIKLWFYVLNVLSTALFDKPAFKDVICTGIIYDENGLKFSKKYGNFKDPFEVLNKYGADALRLYLLSSPLINAQPLHFNEEHIEKVKQKIIPLINAVKFFITQHTDYVKKENQFDVDDYKNTTVLTDKWIISRLSSLIKSVNDKMKSYQLDKVINELFDYIEDLTNWYIKFNRNRLRGLSGKKEWSVSLSNLYVVLYNFIKIMAPFAPFLAEYLFKSINMENNESVLLELYPASDIFTYNQDIECKMDRLKKVVKLVRILRDKTNNHKTIRVPLKKIIVYHNDQQFLDDIQIVEDLAQEEMNCDMFEYKKFTENVVYSLTINQKSVGSRYKSKMVLIKNNIDNISQNDIDLFVCGQIDKINLVVNDEIYTLLKDDMIINIKAKNSDPNYLSDTDNYEKCMVSIDTTYDDKSHSEYQLRLLLRDVQLLRKKTDLNPWNKIKVYLHCVDHDVNSYLLNKKVSNDLKLKCDTYYTNTCHNIYASDVYKWNTIDGLQHDVNIYIELV